MNTVRSPRAESFFAKKLTFRHLLTKRYYLLSICVLMLTVGTTVAYFRYGTSSSSTESIKKDDAGSLLEVPVTTVESVSQFDQRRTYTGLTRARRSSELAFNRPTGKLIALLVDDGDTVCQGDVLAKLDQRDLLARKQQVLAEKRQAEAVLAELIAGYRQEKIDSAAAQVKELEALLQQMRLALTRQKNLLQRQATSLEEYEQKKFAYDAQLAKLANAKANYEDLRKGYRQEKIEAQKAVVASLEASLTAIDIDLDDCLLKAPFSGRISHRYVDEGTIISANTPIVKLVETEHLEVTLGIPASQASSVTIGKHHSLEIHNETVTGEVTAILPELNSQTRTRQIVLALSSASSNRIVPGQVAKLTLREANDTNGFWLPLSALSRGTRGLWSAYAVVDDANGQGTVERRDIEILYTSGERVLVRGTLEAGDRIIATGTHRVVPQQKVRPIMP